MPKFRVFAVETIHYYTDIEAPSKEGALEVAEGMGWDEFFDAQANEWRVDWAKRLLPDNAEVESE